jgi:hypothetical protein
MPSAFPAVKIEIVIANQASNAVMSCKARREPAIFVYAKSGMKGMVKTFIVLLFG